MRVIRALKSQGRTSVPSQGIKSPVKPILEEELGAPDEGDIGV